MLKIILFLLTLMLFVVGDIKVKKFLNSIIQEELAPIRQRRNEWEKRIPEVYEILRAGSEIAKKKAEETLTDVRRAMKINYFEEMNFK